MGKACRVNIGWQINNVWRIRQVNQKGMPMTGNLYRKKNNVISRERG
jgi:hypothetical protein